MIREISPKEYDLVFEFAKKDIGRNYFILLGLTSKKQIYNKIYGEFDQNGLRAILCLRKSGVLQFYSPGDFNVEGFASIISSMDYNGLIGPKSYCEAFLHKGLFSSFTNGAFISKLSKDDYIPKTEENYQLRPINTCDLDEIVEIYKECFSSFSPKEIMEEKLSKNRGRGVCIHEDGKIISLGQTDFETEDGAVIVGVATRNNYRCRGLATKCLESLCSTLIGEGRELYLQYDNLEAGKIYEKLGFKVIDRVIHCKK